jgi:hypothetical protein
VAVQALSRGEAVLDDALVPQSPDRKLMGELRAALAAPARAK